MASKAVSDTAAAGEAVDVDRKQLERDVHELCKESPEGADFLVSSFVQSLRSYRRPTICAPFPTALFNTGGALPDKDFCAAEDCIAHIPRIHTIVAAGPPTPAGALETEPKPHSEPRSGTTSGDHPLSALPLKALRLLHWILSYRRTVRLVVDPAQELASLFPEGQPPWASTGASLHASSASLEQQEELRPHYVMEIRDREDSCWDRGTEIFEAARVKAGSFLAFHGTPAENIHCVLRCGLLNMTGTREQRNGAIFGDGIYLSTDPAVGFTYAAAGEGWERSSLGARARFVLVCEVANGAEVSRSHSSAPESHTFQPAEAEAEGAGRRPGPPLGTYILVLNKDLVKVRYVFVYSERSRCVPRSQGVSERTGGAPGGTLGGQVGAGGQVLRGSVPARKVDWCTVFVVAYIAILVGVGLIDSDIFRHVRLPPGLQSLW